MSKFSFRRGELEQLDKDIKKWNKRVNELRKQGYNESLIPEKKNYYTELNKILENKDYTRQQFKETFQIIEAFNKKGSEKILKSSRGLELPKFKKEEIDIKNKAINRERAKLQRELSGQTLTDRNLPVEMPEENKKLFNANKIMPKKFNWKNMSKKDFEMYMKTLSEYDQKKEEKNNLYRSNFYKALENQLTPDDYKRIKNILDQIPTEKIVNKYYTDLNMNIDFIYESSDYEGRVEAIIDSWNSVKEQGGY